MFATKEEELTSFEKRIKKNVEGLLDELKRLKNAKENNIWPCGPCCEVKHKEGSIFIHEPEQGRMYIWSIMHYVFAKIAKGELDAPGLCHESLSNLNDYLVFNMADGNHPYDKLASESGFFITTIHEMENAFRKPLFKKNFIEKGCPTERDDAFLQLEILFALWRPNKEDDEARYFWDADRVISRISEFDLWFASQFSVESSADDDEVRIEMCRKINLILEQLFHKDLFVRVPQRIRNSGVWFYKLGVHGEDLCERLRKEQWFVKMFEIIGKN